MNVPTNNGTSDRTTRLLELTAQLVVAYLQRNAVPSDQVPRLIAQIHEGLSAVSVFSGPTSSQVPQMPAVPIRNSVTTEAIICLEDGLPFRSLKRHLRTRYGMTAQQYREKWSLPVDYPMVAPSYSAKRSALAKAHGLGRKSEAEVLQTNPSGKPSQQPRRR